MNLRKVYLTKFEDGTGPYDIQGLFHTWGTKAIYGERGETLQISVGIVELDNGNVVLVEPSRIKFQK